MNYLWHNPADVIVFGYALHEIRWAIINRPWSIGWM
jgi:hypothetical protein